ncbi:MAG: PAS domain-containing protein [Candidatus Shapirobacteria bacterium]|jgi:hypothetical protein
MIIQLFLDKDSPYYENTQSNDKKECTHDEKSFAILASRRHGFCRPHIRLDAGRQIRHPKMELIHNENRRVALLVEYLRLLSGGPVSRETFDRYDSALSTVTAFEVNEALDEVLAAADVESWKIPVARFIRSVSKGLDAEILPFYPKDSLLARLEEENDSIAGEMAAMQRLARAVRAGDAGREELRESIGRFSLLKHHYVSLQNDLFPRFERASPRHACVKLMWSMQDDAMRFQSLFAKSGGDDEKTFWKALGDFFLTAGSLAYRERHILFPVAFRAIAASPQGFGAAPDRAADAAPGSIPALFSSPTGSLALNELEAIFKVLPFDMSFIGKDDRVRFYSDPPHRIFPRSPAVVGRLVQNCHPPKSVATVEEILRSFKSGEKDSAEFWLEKGEAFIHIQYFAVRDGAGDYLGTLEVSQNAAHIRSLEGEKRLL